MSGREDNRQPSFHPKSRQMAIDQADELDILTNDSLGNSK